LVEVEQT
jgi:hypothetical protein